MKTILLTSKKNGKTFLVEMTAIAPDFRVSIKAFGVPARLQDHPDSGECITIEQDHFRSAKIELERFFSLFLRVSRTWIRVTEESANEMRAVLAGFAEQKTAWESARNAAASKLPVSYKMHDYEDRGDYTSNHERRISISRDPMSEFLETGEVTVKTYVLDNLKVDAEQWNADFTFAGGNANTSSVSIPAQVAENWIAIHDAIHAQLEKEAGELEAIRKLNKELAEAVKAEKFSQAAATGKPVVLTSRFLSGSDIPRQFRDDDSDMGTLYVLAMPDGSTQEDFGHAY